MKKKKSNTKQKTSTKEPKKPRADKTQKPHYVNAKEFEEEIKAYYKTGDMSIKLGESLTKIANGLSYAPNFINYTYKDDMIGDAVVKMFSALKSKKFRLNSGFSPFSYFTTIAFHAFINRIKKEKKHNDAINDYKEKVYTDIMHEDPEGKKVYIRPTHDDEGGDHDMFQNLNG